MNALHHGRSLRRQVGPATTATARRCRPVRSRVMDAARGESRTALTGDMNASQQTTAWFAAARLGWKKMACGRRREARVAGGSRPESERLQLLTATSNQPSEDVHQPYRQNDIAIGHDSSLALLRLRLYAGHDADGTRVYGRGHPSRSSPVRGTGSVCT
jgi:hypothetical protein